MSAKKAILVLVIGPLLLAGVIAGVAYYLNSNSSANAVKACTHEGIEYFREIGSYPTLSDGSRAADVARERCERTGGSYGWGN